MRLYTNCLRRYSAIDADTPQCNLLLDFLHLNPLMWYVDDVGPAWGSTQEHRRGGAYQ